MITLSADLTLANATTVLAQGLAQLRQGDAEFDCSALNRVDSAALAVMLAWQREAGATGQRLQLRGLPPKLVGLAEAYGVVGLLGDAIVPGESPAFTAA